ncbi:hypothetical protein BH20ACT3_BH20ACT3_10920 [soil metagenome]
MDQIRLVLGVARLGERDLFGWWRSHGLSTTGGYVLPGILRRTWHCAALELDVASAARRHQDILCRPSALHLFSDQLPYRRLAAGWLAGQKLSRETGELIETLRRWTPDVAAEELRAWAGDVPADAEPVGDGLRLGRVDAADLDDPARLDDLAAQLAAGYLASDDRRLRIPYVDLT